MSSLTILRQMDPWAQAYCTTLSALGITIVGLGATEHFEFIEAQLVKGPSNNKGKKKCRSRLKWDVVLCHDAMQFV
jgi:hypothetical protein